MVTAQKVELPTDASGHPIPVLGNYGSNQDVAVVDESLVDSVTDVTEYDLTSAITTPNGNYGELAVDGIYQMRVRATDSPWTLFYRFGASGATRPVAVATDTFFPIGRIPVWTFKVMPGQEQLSLYFNAAGTNPDITFVRLR